MTRPPTPRERLAMFALGAVVGRVVVGWCMWRDAQPRMHHYSKPTRQQHYGHDLWGYDEFRRRYGADNPGAN